MLSNVNHSQAHGTLLSKKAQPLQEPHDRVFYLAQGTKSVRAGGKIEIKTRKVRKKEKKDLRETSQEPPKRKIRLWPAGAHELQGLNTSICRGEKDMNDMTQAELEAFRKEARSVAFYEVIELIRDGKTVDQILDILKEKVKA